MSYDDRIKQVRKLLDARNLSTAGRHRDLVGRLLEALEEDDTTDLDDDEWAWIYDTKDDIMVQAETRWRREMALIYNKQREDFMREASVDEASSRSAAAAGGSGQVYDLAAHNEYMEMVERIIFALTESDGDDTARNKVLAEVERYKSENAETIARNQARALEEQRTVEMENAREETIRDERRRLFALENAAHKRDVAVRIRESNEVALGERDAAAMSAPSVLSTAVRDGNIAASDAQSGAASRVAMALQEPLQPKPLDEMGASSLKMAQRVSKSELLARQKRAAGAVAFNARDLDMLCSAMSCTPSPMSIA